MAVVEHKYCRATKCPIQVIGPFMNTFLSYGIAFAVLAVPFINSLGADVKNITSVFGVTQFSFTSLSLLLAMIVSGIISSHERHTHPLLCIVHSCGVPGVILALLAAANP